MNAKDIISSGLLESYVLGTCTAEEAALVRGLCRQHPELLQEIEAIENSLMQASSQLGRPNPALKEKIAAQLDFNAPVKSSETKTIPLKQRSMGLYKFGMAASLLLCITSLFYAFMLQRRLNQLNSELAELNAAKTYMAQEVQIQKAAMTVTQEQLQIAADPRVKKIALNGMNSLSHMGAAVLWNSQTKEVYFNAKAMPLPKGKQYQLWAIVKGKPVDAGMIELSEGQIFQKMKIIPEAQAFAVTIEKMGGSPTPSVETMCLLGNV